MFLYIDSLDPPTSRLPRNYEKRPNSELNSGEAENERKLL
jgi:hypothetical protein